MNNNDPFKDVDFNWNLDWVDGSFIDDTFLETNEEKIVKQSTKPKINLYKLIHESTKGEFHDFVEYDNDGLILEILTDEGFEILASYNYCGDRIKYILAFSPYKETIMKDERIMDLMLKNKSSYYCELKHISLETCTIFLERALKTNNDSIIVDVFRELSDEHQDKLLEKLYDHQNVLYSLINISRAEIINRIINEMRINLANPKVEYRYLFDHAKAIQGSSKRKRNENDEIIETVNINTNLLTADVCQSIYEKYNIFEVRRIINDAEYCTDATPINNYVKKQELKIIEQASNSPLISPYKEIYTALKNMALLRKENKYEDYYKEQDNLYNYFKKIHDTERRIIQDNLDNNEIKLLEVLENLSNRMLSNIIIDYHFEENYHNIMIDVEELLNLHFSGNISLPEDKLYLYQDIRNIDYLPREQQLEIHERLKNINMIETFYDDMSYARTFVRQALKESALTKDELKQYKNEELSKEYGVNVYTINDEPFFALVKSQVHGGNDQLPTGHSFSLVGNGGLATWQDTRNYVYDTTDLNPEQIIHIYPFDSYTMSKPHQDNCTPTTRINALMMPDELVEYSNSYNEILILEQGYEQTDMDKNIPKLKRIAKYCVDQITEEDVKEAEAQGIGILLINSKKCIKSDNKERGLYRHRLQNLLNEEDIDYFDGYYHTKEFEAKR